MTNATPGMDKIAGCDVIADEISGFLIEDHEFVPMRIINPFISLLPAIVGTDADARCPVERRDAADTTDDLKFSDALHNAAFNPFGWLRTRLAAVNRSRAQSASQKRSFDPRLNEPDTYRDCKQHTAPAIRMSRLRVYW